MHGLAFVKEEDLKVDHGVKIEIDRPFIAHVKMGLKEIFR